MSYAWGTAHSRAASLRASQEYGQDYTMKYEVRYIVDGEEFTEEVEVETAAEAAETVKQHHPNPGDSFELIQVHLIDELVESSEQESEG